MSSLGGDAWRRLLLTCTLVVSGKLHVVASSGLQWRPTS